MKSLNGKAKKQMLYGSMYYLKSVSTLSKILTAIRSMNGVQIHRNLKGLDTLKDMSILFPQINAAIQDEARDLFAFIEENVELAIKEHGSAPKLISLGLWNYKILQEPLVIHTRGGSIKVEPNRLDMMEPDPNGYTSGDDGEYYETDLTRVWIHMRPEQC